MSSPRPSTPNLVLAPSSPRKTRTRPPAGDFVVFIVPDRHHRIRRLRISRRRLNQCIFGLGLLSLALIAAAAHYFFSWQKASQVDHLRAENLALTSQVHAAQTELMRLDRQFTALEGQLARVRAITQLNDPARNLAMEPQALADAKPQPVLYVQGERIDVEDELLDSQSARRLLDQQLDAAKNAASRTQAVAHDLSQFLSARPSLVANTPSIYPVASRLLTAKFGARRDPFTGQDVWHKGVDFAADIGAPVWAPADGRVVFAGTRGQGLGDVLVLDHGFAVQTHFAHLSHFDVSQGDHVRRGQQVARVGNSGRSTGPHLHYEVRMAGLPQDPEPYLLD